MAARVRESKLAAGLDHEVRTPLNSIIGFSEIIRNELFGPLGNGKYREYIDDILTSAAELNHIITDNHGAEPRPRRPARKAAAARGAAVARLCNGKARAPVVVLSCADGGPGPDYLDVLDKAGIVALQSASVAQAKQLVAEKAPFACLVHIGPGSELRAADLENLLEPAPHLRLIAMVDAGCARTDGLAEFVANALIYDFHTLPVEPDRLLYTLGHVHGLAELEQRSSASYKATAKSEPYLVGSSPAMQSIFASIRKFAKVDAPVLITGESGTGKELAALAIHEHSESRDGPFVAINCAAVPPTLIESELFGYEKGAFTGAHQRKIGRIETAQGGTLFLDEIGDLPPEVQVHFLRFLQERTMSRLGGTKSLTVDTRVIASTNVNLEGAVKANRFREDLYYRLKVLCLHMPPLRERGEDIDLLARFFLHKFARDHGRNGLRFSRKASDIIRRHHWPGNVRELISTVRRGAVMAEGKVVKPSDLGLEGVVDDQQPLPTLAEARARHDKEIIETALRINGYSVQNAARELGISRVALYRLLRKYDIRSPQTAA